MKRNLMLLWVLALSLRALAAESREPTADSPQPCRIQLVENQFRCVAPQGYQVRSGVPSGYAMRPGDCPGNDIWSLYRDNATLADCEGLCSLSSQCRAFMFYDNHRCFPKTKTCDTTSKTDPLNIFYDKLPVSEYAMRPGDCPGNDIWSIHGFVSLAECGQRCRDNPTCVSFMFFDGRECFPKTKTCETTDTADPKNFFYDKIH